MSPGLPSGANLCCMSNRAALSRGWGLKVSRTMVVHSSGAEGFFVLSLLSPFDVVSAASSALSEANLSGDSGCQFHVYRAIVFPIAVL